MKLAKDILFLLVLIALISWNVILAYLMITYVNSIEDVNGCRDLARTEGTLIQSFGMFKMAIYCVILAMGLLTAVFNIMK